MIRKQVQALAAVFLDALILFEMDMRDRVMIRYTQSTAGPSSTADRREPILSPN